MRNIKSKEYEFRIKFTNFCSELDPGEIEKHLNDYYYEGPNDDQEYIQIKPLIHKVKRLKNSEDVFIYEYMINDIYTNNYKSIDAIVTFIMYSMIDRIFNDDHFMYVYIYKMYDNPVGGYMIKHKGIRLMYSKFVLSNDEIISNEELIEEDEDDNNNDEEGESIC